MRCFSEFDQATGTRRLLISLLRFMRDVTPTVALDEATISDIQDIEASILRQEPINVSEVGHWGFAWQQMHNRRAKKDLKRRMIGVLVEVAAYAAEAACRKNYPIKIPHWVAIIILGDIS
jgi:hypothetical protein